ncbi:Hypothetical protein I595_2750 [Croceitalea dokdonensis DOKDO 023]|uniref:Membrane metalloprotease n=2 Tax=Croceitalea TaxID=574891 RepID=A0A0P7AE57_9FLAO|nr:Hypothetical protein I595_2750 [Croceitalea dokdonensis DOKDO 023]
MFKKKRYLRQNKRMKSVVFATLTFMFSMLLACSSDAENPNGGEETETEVDRTGNLLSTGASANDILSNARFDRLLIEIAFVEGFRPSPVTMNAFEEFLRENTFKQNIELTYKELPPTGEESLTLTQIDSLEQANRTAYNTGSTLAIYIFFADAPSDGDDLEEGLVTLGAVFRNTSMVIYERTVRTLANRSLSLLISDVETATLNHEFGHLFGLVNLGTVPINDHEDPDAPFHCSENPCLMRAELQFGTSGKAFVQRKHANDVHSSCSLNGLNLIQTMENRVARGIAAAPGLDPECLRDLESNGGRPSTNN